MTKEISQEEVMSLVERSIKESQAELKTHLRLLKHGQKERLIDAIAQYPIEDMDAKGEPQPMRDAWACLKRIVDAQVALGVEVVIQQMAKNHGVKTEENNG